MNPARLPVVVAAADIESGVTSWALRFRDACREHPRLDVRAINCWKTGNGVGDFDAEITTEAGMRAYLAGVPRALLVPNFVWELFPMAASMVRQGHELYTLGYARSDSEKEYYAPLAWVEPVVGAFIASSPECAAHLAERIPARRRDIFAAPSGVDVPHILTRSWQTTPLRLIYGGRIVQEQKRVLDFIPLVDRLLKQATAFTFTIIGAGAQREELRVRFSQLPHGGRVTFEDPVPSSAMPAVWRAHDIFLQTSEYEGTSSSMLEAMAQGCVPLVTDATSGVRSVLTHGENGIIVPIGDMDALARHIHDLAREPLRVESLGRAAHAAALPYAMPRYLERFEEAAGVALAHPPRTWPAGDKRSRFWELAGGWGTPLASQHRFLRPSFPKRILRRLLK